MNTFTKEQYIAWKEKSFDDWTREECRAADAHVREETLKNLDKWAVQNIKDETARRFFLGSASAFFGSVETDDMLMKLGMSRITYKGERQ